MPKTEKKPTVDSLIRDLKSKDAAVREEAAHELGEMGPSAKKAIPPLTKALADDDCWLPGTAAEALGKLGPTAVKAVPGLIKLLVGSTPQLQSTVVTTIASFGSKALPDIEKLFKSEDEGLRTIVMSILGESQASCKRTISLLHNAIEDSHSLVRIAAVEALALKGKSATGELIIGLGDEHSVVRTKSAEALGAIGAGAKKALSVLRKMDSDRVKEVKQAASKAVTAITAEETA